MGTPCHFALFDLKPDFELDLAQLADRYRELARQVHPDRFADAGESEQRQGISLSYLEQLFAKLRRGSLVTSVRGPGTDICRAPADRKSTRLNSSH